jgi:hypothetical protein
MAPQSQAITRRKFLHLIFIIIQILLAKNNLKECLLARLTQRQQIECHCFLMGMLMGLITGLIIHKKHQKFYILHQRRPLPRFLSIFVR